MARVYLEEEIRDIIAAATTKLANASRIVSDTEKAVQKSITAGQTPVEANGVGTEGYQAAGILISEAIAMLTTLNVDASAGLVYPMLAQIGLPVFFDKVHFDANGSDEFYLQAYSHDRQIPLSSSYAPFDSVFADGDIVKILEADATEGSPQNLTGIAGWVGTIKTSGISTTGTPDRNQILFEETYNYQGTDHVDANAGGESSTFIMRLVDR